VNRSTTRSGPAAGTEARGAGGAPMLQRKCDCGTHASGGECPECQRKKVQRKRSGGAEEFEIPPIVHSVLRGPGAALDPATRASMESRFGHDFSDVRVHTDARAASSARAVDALAYTAGRDVVFGQGQYSPHSGSGRRLLAHELAHVVQQRGSSGSVGATGRPDASLERDADRAAERVASGAPAPSIGAAGRPILARQAVPAESSTKSSATRCQKKPTLGDLLKPLPIRIGQAPKEGSKVTRVESLGNDRKRVVLDSGQRYVVTRTPWTERGTGPVTRSSTRADIDRKETWVEIEWCRGSTEGKIRASVNVPEQAIALLRNAIANGGDLDAAWRQASITPTVTGSYRIGKLDLTASAEVTVGTDGEVKGGKGTVGVSKDVPGGRIGGEISGSGDSQGGAQVGVTLKIEWGAEPRKVPKCEKEWVRSGYRYSCEEERDVKPSKGVGERDVTTNDARAYNLFFEYARPDFREKDNAGALAALGVDLAGGFRVSSIEGWTSPEGSTGPGRGFEGNETLSQKRADAAKQRVEALCATGDCFESGAPTTGMGERMDVVDPETGKRVDAKGAKLEKHVDESFAEDAGETSVRTPELMDSLKKARSSRERARKIYPWLRRAIVRLRRSETKTESCTFDIPGTTETLGIGNCPAHIRDAAFPDGKKGKG
jgi:hypothetical protein